MTVALLVGAIPSPPSNAIGIGPLQLRAYGLAIAVGVLVAVWVAQRRWAARNGAPQGSWLARMLGKKPRLVVAIALANRMARCAWAMLTKNEDYREPVAAVA